MNCCNHCQDAGKFFNEKTAKKELRRYKKKGADKSTRLLIEEIKKNDLHGKSLLDIGGGIGAISYGLIQHGIEVSVHVDASTAYLNTFSSEIERRELNDRITPQYGDFTELSGEIEAADVVTLDRVICCYPDMGKLVDRSTAKAKFYYGVVYPRDRLLARIFMFIGNLYFKLRGIYFRTYLHLPSEIDARIRANGFRKSSQMQTFIWEVVLYSRKDP